MTTLDSTHDDVDFLTESQARAALESALTDPIAKRIPAATYRVQFNEHFTFGDARRRAGYLHRLGVTDLYASPYFHATSPHGYDVTDHSEVNPALGGEEAYQALIAELQRLEMGHVMDVVPNHMGVASNDNAWWNDVLENGQASPYAAYFDIEWRPLKRTMEGQVLLPLLGDQYGHCLERGELTLRLRDGAFELLYGERIFPISPSTYGGPLELALKRAREEGEEEVVMELESILTAISHLPSHNDTDPERVTERQREKEVIKRRLARLVEESAEVEEAIADAIESYNGVVGEPTSFDRLDELLAQQPYRLAFWRVAAEEINYRRFFDINDLAAIRMEVDEVFDEAHELVMRLIGEGAVTGLRIDHPDGLWDPAAYFLALQRGAAAARARVALERERGPLAPEEVAVLMDEARALEEAIGRAKPLYLLVEKIVEHGEALPAGWPVHGTTGYEFMNAIGGLYVDGRQEEALTRVYEQFTGESTRFDDILYYSKLRVLRTSLASELAVLAHRLNLLAERNRHYRDFTLGTLMQALREVIATFPIYRTYMTTLTESVSRHDREAIEKAVRLARRRNPELDSSVWKFLNDLLHLELPDTSTDEELLEHRTFLMRFQQLTGPVMAKGLEDTAFYRYNRLVSLNEVGGDARVFGMTVEGFHHHNTVQRREWPHRMLSTSTHDTKRSEDVRARIAVLSESPDEWASALERWQALNEAKGREVEGERYPSRNDEYLLYQTLLGAWPLDAGEGAPGDAFVERIVAYMNKAANEAKVHTSWSNPNPDYSEALEQFTRAVLEDDAFLRDFLPVQRRVAAFGALNSLSLVALKYASPGVPDLYQGNERWDFSLVDPDNRRPVDFEALEQALAALEKEAERRDPAEIARELAGQWEDGRVKLWATHRALTHRRANHALYRDGDYHPLTPTGEAAEHLVTFVRSTGEQSVVAVAPRLLLTLAARHDGEPASVAPGGAAWSGTSLALPAGRYRNIYTEEILESRGEVGVDQIFAAFPVALLERIEA